MDVGHFFIYFLYDHTSEQNKSIFSFFNRFIDKKIFSNKITFTNENDFSIIAFPFRFYLISDYNFFLQMQTQT